MVDSRSEEFLRPYREAAAAHGGGFEATLWGSRAAQQRRFDVMTELVDFTGTTIVDAGCGPGDFAARLHERGVAYASFIGLDALPEVLETAAGRGLPRCRFVHADLLGDEEAFPVAPAPDWITFSGTLNTMEPETARQLVDRAFRAARRGVAFNFLSDRPHARWLERPLGPARRFDVLGWIDWALDRSSRVQFTQAYLDGHDATIVIARDE